MNNVKEYLSGKLPWLINNYDNPDEIARILYERLQSNFNYTGNSDKAIEKIKESVNLYKTNPQSIDDIVDDLCYNLEEIETTNTKSSETDTNTYNQPSHPISSQNNKKTIDVEGDELESVLTDYQLIQEEADGNTVSADGYVQEVYNKYKPTIVAKEEEISELIQEIGIEAISFLEEIEAIDSTTAAMLTNDDIAFSELLGIYSMYEGTGSTIKEADAEMFIKAGYQVTNGVVTIVDSDGVKYEYDISTNKLTDSNGNSLTVKYYVPSECSDLSSLNTVTCLGGQGEGSMYETTGANSFYLNDISTNAMLVVPKKKHKSGIDINKASFSYMSNDVMAATKFATAKQNSDCKNSIIGCSSGGGSALKIAAQAGDLYDNVISINYAAIFQGDSKGVNGGDDNRLTEAEAKALNGKNLVFISTSADKNIVEGGKNSYVYRGLERILGYCPDSDVTLITNNTSKIYENIDNDNYHYFGGESAFWTQNFGNYVGHGDYHKVFRDIINSNVLGANGSLS